MDTPCNGHGQYGTGKTRKFNVNLPHNIGHWVISVAKMYGYLQHNYGPTKLRSF